MAQGPPAAIGHLGAGLDQPGVEQLEPRHGMPGAQPPPFLVGLALGGQALHGKKPGYFAADKLPPYDRDLQHARENAGRPMDPTGCRHRQWLETVEEALTARQAHLQRVRSPAADVGDGQGLPP